MRNIASRGESRRLREQDSFAFVGFHLPFVGRVRLPDIDDEEFYLSAETSIERRKVPSLGTKRRSGIAAENQGYRLSSAKGRELHLLDAPKARQLELGRV